MFDQEMLQKLGLALAIVAEIFVMTLVGLAVGYGIDHWAGFHGHWGAVVFAFAGLGGGFYRAAQLLKKI